MKRRRKRTFDTFHVVEGVFGGSYAGGRFRVDGGPSNYDTSGLVFRTREEANQAADHFNRLFDQAGWTRMSV